MTDHTSDDFQWLESLDDAAALEWVARQNAATQTLLDSDPRFDALKDSILANLRDTRQIPFFAEYDGWLYNFHQDGEHGPVPDVPPVVLIFEQAERGPRFRRAQPCKLPR